MSVPSFIEFNTADGLTLPGLLYQPKDSKKVIISLHGNGSSSVFYNEKVSRTIAEIFAKKGVSLLVFNNRGANIIKKLNVKNKNGEEERKKYGMAYEKIKDCVEDIDGAITYLVKQGFKEFYLMGSSTGANKICVYNFYKPENKISKYILLAGGDDTGTYFNILGKEKLSKLLIKAKEKIENGKGEDIITDSELFPDYIFSYASFFDIANPDGDYNCFPFYEVINNVKLSEKPLFRYFNSIIKPTLVVYGEKDEYAWGDVPKVVEILKKQQPNFTYEIIKDADHRFTDHKEKLAELIVHWL